MLIKNIILLGSVMLFGSCGNEAKTSSEVNGDSMTTQNETQPAPDSLSSGCYAQIAGRDTSNIQIENKSNNVTGTLSYAIFEKDRNDGTLQAEIEGDVLTGWYLFKSEGVISVRQVAWKIKGTELWPATGEMMEKNDSMFFSAPDKLTFDNTRPFKKVACVI